MQRSDGKRAIFASVIQYLVELAIALLVLFHDYGNKDTTVVVSLLVVAYGMIRSTRVGRGRDVRNVLLRVVKAASAERGVR